MKRVAWSGLVVVGMAVVLGCSGGSSDEDTTVPSDTAEGDVADVRVEELALDETGPEVAEPDLTLPDQTGDVGTPEVADESGGDDQWSGRYGTACDASKRVGKFQVGLKKYGSEFSGKVYDSVDFSGVPTLKQEEGECQILQRKPLFCDPACESGLRCNDQGACVAMPAPVDVGSVSVTGLSKPVALEADAGLNYTFLDFDEAAFEPGSEIELVATGAVGYEVSLQGAGVEPLELETTDWTLVMDAPLEAHWTAGSGEAEILISLNVDQHGSTPATLVCRVADTGSYTISAKMVKNLLLYGVNGAPTAYVYRRTVDSAAVEGGCLEFEVYSQVNLKVSVEQ